LFAKNAVKNAQIAIIEYAPNANINAFVGLLFFVASAFYQMKNCVHMNALSL
jgi:hypothetical protein